MDLFQEELSCVLAFLSLCSTDTHYIPSFTTEMQTLLGVKCRNCFHCTATQQRSKMINDEFSEITQGKEGDKMYQSNVEFGEDTRSNASYFVMSSSLTTIVLALYTDGPIYVVMRVRNFPSEQLYCRSVEATSHQPFGLLVKPLENRHCYKMNIISTLNWQQEIIILGYSLIPWPLSF